MKPEFALKLCTYIPWLECINHRVKEHTIFRVLDAEEKNVLREVQYSLNDIESFGVTDFEYFYGKDASSAIAQRKKWLCAS